MATLPTLRNVLKWLASTLAVSLGLGGTALYLLQSRLIYPANLPAGSRQNVPRPEEFGMPGEEVQLTSPDGVNVKAFVIKAPGDPSLRPTVLLLHANAGNVVSRARDLSGVTAPNPALITDVPSLSLPSAGPPTPDRQGLLAQDALQRRRLVLPRVSRPSPLRRKDRLHALSARV